MELEQQRAELARRGFGAAAISYDTQGVLRAFAARRQISVPLLSDPDSAIIRAFGIFNETTKPGALDHGVPYPGLFFLDAKGRVTARYFEERYTDRFTISSILRRRMGAAAAIRAEPIQAARLTATPLASTAMLAPGQRVTLELEIAMPKGLHVYAPGAPADYIALDLALDASPLWKAHPTEYPKSRTTKIAREHVPVFERTFNVVRDVTVYPDAKLRLGASTSDLTVTGKLRYQACDRKQCFPPETVPVAWKLSVGMFDRERAPAEFRRQAGR
ncbi:MAG: redoxin domain-containing protein [Acidobacteria bacterium]|nr:redoxin domain-containing protein [Acidobacteriota bacterium]